MLDAFGNQRRVILAASTHAGEDAWIASAIRKAAPEALPVIVPRHAERRGEVKAELERAGFEVVLRSKFQATARRPTIGATFSSSTPPANCAIGRRTPTW